MMPSATPRVYLLGPTGGHAVLPVGFGHEPARHHQRLGPKPKAAAASGPARGAQALHVGPMPTHTVPAHSSRISSIERWRFGRSQATVGASGTSSASRTSCCRLTPPHRTCAPLSWIGQFRAAQGSRQAASNADHVDCCLLHVITDGKQHESPSPASGKFAAPVHPGSLIAVYRLQLVRAATQQGFTSSPSETNGGHHRSRWIRKSSPAKGLCEPIRSICMTQAGREERQPAPMIAR